MRVAVVLKVAGEERTAVREKDLAAVAAAIVLVVFGKESEEGVVLLGKVL